VAQTTEVQDYHESMNSLYGKTIKTQIAFETGGRRGVTKE